MTQQNTHHSAGFFTIARNAVNTCCKYTPLRLSGLLIWLALAALPAAAQVGGNNLLVPGKPVEHKLTAEQNHLYPITLKANQFIHLVADQRGIDVVVRLIDPKGNQLVEVDTPNGTQGPEVLMAVTAVSGKHQIEVMPLKEDGSALAGQYIMKLIAVRTATAEDRTLADSQKLFAEAVSLRGEEKYAEAMRVTKRCMVMREKSLGSDREELAAALDLMAILLIDVERYDEAEALYRRALAIREKVFGADSVQAAQSLATLAGFLYDQDENDEAEKLYSRALAMLEKKVGPADFDLVPALEGLGNMYYAAEKFDQALPLYERALAIREKVLGSEHAEVVEALGVVADTLHYQDKYEQAEKLRQRELAIREKLYGADDLTVGATVHALAILAYERREYDKSEELYQRAWTIYEKHHKDAPANLPRVITDLATLYQAKNDFDRAELSLKRALEIHENTFGKDQADTGTAASVLATFYFKQRRYTDAEPLYRRVLAIREKTLAADDPEIALTLLDLSATCYHLGGFQQAEQLCRRALAIREKAFGPEHLLVADALTELAEMHFAKSDYGQAELTTKRALAIREKALGADSTGLYQSLNVLVRISMARGDYQQALKYQTRAAAIGDQDFDKRMAAGSVQSKLASAQEFDFQTCVTLSLHGLIPDDKQATELAVTTLLRRKARPAEAMEDAIAALRKRATAEDKALLARLDEARAKFDEQRQKATEADVANRQSTVWKLYQQKEEIEEEVGTRGAELCKSAQPVSLEAVRSAIPKSAALVEFALYHTYDTKTFEFGDEKYLAFVITPQGKIHRVELGAAEKIDEAVEALGEATGDPNRKDVKQLARKLDELVMQPVRAVLGDAQQLFVSPDGALEEVSFAELVDERGDCLSKRYSLKQLKSGRELLRLR